MSTNTAGTFRVLNTEDDVVLFDLDSQHPVLVKKSDLTTDLVAGNTIDATLSSKDYIGEEGAYEDGIWTLEDYSVRTETEIHYVNDPAKIPDSIEQKCDAIRKTGSTDSDIFPIKSDGDIQAVVSIFPTSHTPGFWDELKLGLRSIEPEIRNNFDPPTHEPNTPPYEIVFVNIEDEFFVAFYFHEHGTQLAQQIANL